MAASTGDKITDVRNAARPNSARATGTRSAGGTSLACDNLAGWPTASKVHFVTYQLNSSSAQVAGTQLDCTGIVSGNTIGSITVVDGTDTGNSVNDVVEMIPTAAWGQDLADALTSQHSRTGTHTTVTATSLATTGNVSVGGTLGVTGATTLTGAVGGTGYSVATISNPYKFSVYRNAGWFTPSGSATKVNFDTKQFDTSSNYDAVTNFRFVAPVSGFYYFSAVAGWTGVNVSNSALYLYKNGSVEITGSQVVATYTVSAGVSGLIQLTATDYVEVFLYTSTNPAGQTGKSNTRFDGFLLSQT